MPRAKKAPKKQRTFWELFKGDEYVLGLWLILLLAVFLLHVFYTGPYLRFDDASYLTLVSQVGTHTFNPILTPRAYGWLFIYTSYLSQALFGTAQSSVVAFTALEYLSLILLTYVLAMRVTKDNKLSLLAALLVCIFPFTIQYSSRLLPDMLLGVIATLSAGLLLSDRKIDWALAGAMAGMLIYVKLMGLAFLIPFGIWAIVSPKRKYVIIPLLIVLAIYTVPFIAYAHNPFYAFQNYGLFQSTLSPTTPGNNLLGLMIVGGIVPEYQHININFQNYSLGILLWLVLLGSVLAIKYKDKKMLLMAGIFWIYLLYLCFGTITLSAYTVGSFITRYLIVVAAPMAILCAYAIKNIAVKFPAKGRGGWIHIAIFLLVFAFLIFALWHTYQIVYYYNSMIHANPFWAPPISANQIG